MDMNLRNMLINRNIKSGVSIISITTTKVTYWLGKIIVL